MQDETGLALYRKAGELDMPVGVMCFKGLGLHIEDIHALLESSPQTKVCVASLPVSSPFLLLGKIMRAQVSLKQLESVKSLEYSMNRGVDPTKFYHGGATIPSRTSDSLRAADRDYAL